MKSRTNPNKLQCKAKSKQSGQRCKNWAIPGYKVCRMHGAGTPKKGKPGGRPPKNGKWSEKLPTNLLALYEEARSDPNLLALTEEIAVVDARLGEKMEGLGQEPLSATWDKVADYATEINLAMRAGDIPGVMARIEKLGTLAQQAHETREGWLEIYSLLEQRRKLVESERKRLVEMQQFIAAERVAVLAKAILAVIMDRVKDSPTRKAIAYDIGMLISRDNPTALLPMTHVQ